MLRASVIGTRLADRLGLRPDQRATVFYCGLVSWIGCHAGSREYASWFGDDIAVRRDSYDVDWSGLPYLRFLVRNVGRGRPLPQRAQGLGALLLDALLLDARGHLGRLDGGGLPTGTKGTQHPGGDPGGTGGRYGRGPPPPARSRGRRRDGPGPPGPAIRPRDRCRVRGLRRGPAERRGPARLLARRPAGGRRYRR